MLYILLLSYSHILTVKHFVMSVISDDGLHDVL